MMNRWKRSNGVFFYATLFLFQAVVFWLCENHKLAVWLLFVAVAELIIGIIEKNKENRASNEGVK